MACDTEAHIKSTAAIEHKVSSIISPQDSIPSTFPPFVPFISNMTDSSAMNKTTALVEEKLAKAAPQDFEQAKDLLADMIIEVLSIGGDGCLVRTVNLCLTKPSEHLQGRFHLRARLSESRWARRVGHSCLIYSLVLELHYSGMSMCRLLESWTSYRNARQSSSERGSPSSPRQKQLSDFLADPGAALFQDWRLLPLEVFTSSISARHSSAERDIPGLSHQIQLYGSVSGSAVALPDLGMGFRQLSASRSHW